MKNKLILYVSLLGLVCSLSWGMEDSTPLLPEQIEVGGPLVGTLGELQTKLGQKNAELKQLEEQLALLPVYEAQQEELHDPERAARLEEIPGKAAEEELTQSLMEYHQAEPQREETQKVIEGLLPLQQKRLTLQQEIATLEGKIAKLQEAQAIIEEATPGGPEITSSSIQPTQPTIPEQPVPPAPGWSTKQKVGAAGMAILAAITTAIAGGYLYKNAPVWRKQRIKKALQEFDKEITDLSAAERELLMAISYGKYNPLGYIPGMRASTFRQAVAAMPFGQEVADDLWPVLYRLYYGRKALRKEQRELKKIYQEGREQARIVSAQKVAQVKKRIKSKRKVV